MDSSALGPVVAMGLLGAIMGNSGRKRRRRVGSGDSSGGGLMGEIMKSIYGHDASMDEQNKLMLASELQNLGWLGQHGAEQGLSFDPATLEQMKKRGLPGQGFADQGAQMFQKSGITPIALALAEAGQMTPDAVLGSKGWGGLNQAIGGSSELPEAFQKAALVEAGRKQLGGQGGLTALSGLLPGQGQSAMEDMAANPSGLLAALGAGTKGVRSAQNDEFTRRENLEHGNAMSELQKRYDLAIEEADYKSALTSKEFDRQYQLKIVGDLLTKKNDDAPIETYDPVLSFHENVSERFKQYKGEEMTPEERDTNVLLPAGTAEVLNSIRRYSMAGAFMPDGTPMSAQQIAKMVVPKIATEMVSFGAYEGNLDACMKALAASTTSAIPLLYGEQKVEGAGQDQPEKEELVAESTKAFDDAVKALMSEAGLSEGEARAMIEAKGISRGGSK